MNLVIEDQCNRSGDEDSLFGSPPPSPTRGRSPSLALPHGSGTQNVGTIALPGSHNRSELPVNPLALSRCHAPELTSRPPASTPTPTQPQQHTNTFNFNYPPPPCSKPKTPGAKKKRSQGKAPADRPRLPPIHLPDPAEPPPANFLRNQQTLLGMAGVVGGVNLSTRSNQRQPRGSTSVNPIVVEDEHDPPPLGRVPPPVDPGVLPIPSSEQIIQSLIKQKNIFPVLESIFKLALAGDSQNFAHLSAHTSSGGRAPSRKKRKLKSVPAGAVDWDVPYPFLQDEGPEAYRTNWEKERGKQLITHLVGLIKSAMKKAATKSYSQQRKLESAMAMPPHGHYPPPVLNQTHTISTVLMDSSNDNVIRPSVYDNCPSPTPSAPTPDSLEQLLNSFLISSDASPAPTVSSDVSSDAFCDPTSPEFDQLSYHSWMTMMEALSSLEADTSSAQSSSSRDSSIPAASPSVHALSPPPHPIDVSNLVIDPTLLAISNGQGPSLTCNDDIPLLSRSPIQSTSSLADPLTPGWEAQFPDPEIYSGEQVAGENPLVAGNGASSQQPHNTSIIASKPSTMMIPEPTERQPSAITTQFRTVTMGKPREELIRKAKERRSQLVAEMERAKVELWETTIEQGVLVQIAKENCS